MTDDVEFFLRELPNRAESRVDRAALVCAFLKLKENKPTVTAKEIRIFFERAHLAQPSATILSQILGSDPRVSMRSGVARSLVKGDAYFKEAFPEFFVDAEQEERSRLSASAKSTLAKTPLIGKDYLDELERMLELYASLHVLENSMRRLIERVLRRDLGENWWENAASQPQKRKHTDRLEKEVTRKWLPARSDLGPLYSLDWSDLISIMRKYEEKFIPIIGEVDFLHRYSDLGLLRHVVAHHGFVENAHDFERVRLALHDWQSQVGAGLSQAV